MIYLMPFINTKDVGPMVMETPPADGSGSITGDVVDFSQATLEGVGPQRTAMVIRQGRRQRLVPLGAYSA